MAVAKSRTSKQKRNKRFSSWLGKGREKMKKAINLGKSILGKPKSFLKKKGDKIIADLMGKSKNEVLIIDESKEDTSIIGESKENTSIIDESKEDTSIIGESKKKIISIMDKSKEDTSVDSDSGIEDKTASN